MPALILATGMATINAVGSSLMAVGVFGLTTAINYAASDLIDWVVAAEFLAGGLLGGLVGLGLASRLSANKDALNRVFAAVVFIVASYVLYRAGSTLFTR